MKDVTVIIPSLNPDSRLGEVTRAMLDVGFSDILIVDDGSDARHRPIFDGLSSVSGVSVLTHTTNRGKGRALKTAFEYLLKNRPDSIGAVTVDGDGQHKPADALACAEAMAAAPSTLILGARRFDNKNMPLRNRCGNMITRFVFKYLCGVNVTDAQTGLRAIPRSRLETFLSVKGERFEYESNILLMLKTYEISYREIPIETVYDPDDYSTHFHPVRDSIRVYGPILRFIASSLGASLIDLVLFTLFNMLLRPYLSDGSRLLVATAAARIISAFVNYMYNRRAVFGSTQPLRTTVWKYYLLAAGQMLCSYGLVWLLTHLLGISGILETVIKLMIDLCLFFVSFKVQRLWVFR